jgi:hypothetical protein
MSSLRYRKDELHHSLIIIHDVLLKDLIAHYETGKACRRGMKRVEKAVKKALKTAKKKKINPASAIGEAQKVFDILHEEIQLTRRALIAISSNLENALDRIHQERIVKPLALIEKARDLFRDKEIDEGLGMLKNSQAEFEKKTLSTTRTTLLGGTSNEVKDIKEQIEAFKKKRLSAL